ncbi:MAG: hypothetical protein IJ217_05335 [Clostridia bacterium]|nr:hypothetical protein [Clostridia bacterium]
MECKIDLEKNKEYYARNDLELCDCSYCKNYYMQIEEKYPKIKEYLFSMNIDIVKPLELMWLDVDENNIAEYVACQYVVFGTCEEDFSNEIDGVRFCITDGHPYTGIENEDHFVLDFAPVKLEMKFIRCPVCGTIEFDPNDYEWSICKECYWEYDKLQVEDPDYWGGANCLSLNEYKKLYEKLKAKDRYFSCRNEKDREMMVKLDRELGLQYHPEAKH